MDNDVEDFVNYNITKKKKKRNKDVLLKYAKTCAIYGIFDCTCCKKDDNNRIFDSVTDETVNQPSTSTSTTRQSNNEDGITEQNSNDDFIDVGIDCIPSTSNISSQEELDKNEEICDSTLTSPTILKVGINESTDLNETPENPMSYIDCIYENSANDSQLNFLNESQCEPQQPNDVSAEIIDLCVDATIPATSDSLTTDETTAFTSIKSEVLPVTEEEEEIDVVNIQPADDTQHILIENNHNHAEQVPEIPENAIKMEFSDDENQIIDILNFDDIDSRENLVNNIENSVNMESTSNANEDEIIDVENLNEEIQTSVSPTSSRSPEPPQLSPPSPEPPQQPQHDNSGSIALRLRRNPGKRRLTSQITINFHKRPRTVRSVMTIDLINNNSNNSIIEITDSPVAPRKVTEVINVDDDDDENEEPDTNTCSPRTIGLGNCPVCLESLAKKEIMSTICGHVYCSRCIKNVIKTTKKCPNCRKNLTLKSIHPLFI